MKLKLCGTNSFIQTHTYTHTDSPMDTHINAQQKKSGGPQTSESP